MSKLFDHQRAMVELGLANEGYGFWYDTGTGKTYGALELIHALKARRSLVLTPLSILEPAWRADFDQFMAPHHPDMKFINLRNQRTKLKRGQWRPAAHIRTIAAINYESFRVLWKEIHAACSWDCIILDESSALKNPKAKQTKAVLQFLQVERGRRAMAGVPPLRVYALSATPAPNVEYEYWAQMQAVAPGLFERNFYRFRARWFTPYGFQLKQWKLSDYMADEFREVLGKASVYVRKQDCLDLPEQTDVVRHVDMTPEQRRAYREIRDELALELKESEWVFAANALAKALRLRQITSGFLQTQLILDPGEGDAVLEKLEQPPSRYEWLSDAKLNGLRELLDHLGPRQLVVWVQFIEEARKVRNLLASRGPTAALIGDQSVGVAPAKRAGVVKDFAARKLQYIVAHPKVAGHGLTMVTCQDVCYYSLSHSWEAYKQSRDRVHRIGQHYPVTYYHLICPGTIDVALLRALRTKRAAHEAIAEYLRVGQ